MEDREGAARGQPRQRVAMPPPREPPPPARPPEVVHGQVADVRWVKQDKNGNIVAWCDIPGESLNPKP